MSSPNNTYGSYISGSSTPSGGTVVTKPPRLQDEDWWRSYFGKAEQNTSPTGTIGQQQTAEYRVGRDEPVQQNLPAQAGQPYEKRTLVSADTNSASGVTGTGATTEQVPPTSAWAGIETIDSYEQFLRNKETVYGSMRDEQTAFYDEQSQKALVTIEEQRQAAIAEANNQKAMVDNAATEQKNAALAEAENQKNLLITMSEEQKNAVYKFAEEQRISDMNYAAQQYQLLLDSINAQKESGMAMATEQRDLLLSMSEEQRQAAYAHAEERKNAATTYANTQYQTLVDAINAQKESGMAMAEEQRQLLLSMSEEQRNAIYSAAESQRVAAEQRADVERERGVVDARSSYEQNKASYGANAEAMGSMGLSGSGYSDYLNSKAYAQQRAETQAANAQADASKREARYAEGQARLQADSDYYQNKYNAEQAYSDRKYQIDTTYQTNMLNAEQGKAQSIYEAESAERDAKYSADSAHAQNQYNAEAQYSQNKYEVDTTYQNNLLGANQSKAQAEHEATSAERESKFNADQAHAQNEYAAESGYSQSKYEAESAERDAKLQSGLSYSENLFNAESQARSDKLTAEQTADAGKFNANLSYKENLLNNDDAIAKHRLEQEQKAEAEAKQAAAKAEEEAQYARAAYTELLSGANSGVYSVEQLEQLASDYGLSPEQTQSLVDAVNTYNANKQTTEAEEEEAVRVEEEKNLAATSYQNYQTISSAIKMDSNSYSESDIDRAVTEKVLSREDADILKKELADARVKEINDLISSGNNEVANARADELYGSGKIDKDTYQKVYYDSWVMDFSITDVTVESIDIVIADLKKDRDSGKISENDFISLTKHAWSKIGTAQTSAQAGITDKTTKTGWLGGKKYTQFTMNGETYKCDKESLNNPNLESILNGISTGTRDREPNEGTIVRYNGKTYAYMYHWVNEGLMGAGSRKGYMTGWTEVTAVDGSDSYGYNIDSGITTTTTPPQHSSGGWTTYEQAAAAGYSNIMTKTEWVKRKSGCNTYQEYLDKMYAKYIG